jgi:uncharacterized membrane protein
MTKLPITYFLTLVAFIVLVAIIGITQAPAMLGVDDVCKADCYKEKVEARAAAATAVE